MSSYSRKFSFHYNPQTGICYRRLDFLGFTAYRVGDDGSVWSCKIKGSKIGRLGKWKPLKLTKLSKGSGYLVVGLYNSDGMNMRYVNQLVLLAFVGPCPSGMEGCHYDGNPANNQLENLRWDTKKGNMQDSVRHGTSHKGERHPLAKFTEEDIRKIRKLYAIGRYSKEQLAEIYGVTWGAIYSVVIRKNWRHI